MSTNANEDQYDIYGDLNLEQERVSQEVFELSEKLKKCEQERASAVAELERSNALVRDLKAENVRLRRNISALFKTAQLELSRTHAMLADARRTSTPASASEAKQAPAKRPRVDAIPPAP